MRRCVICQEKFGTDEFIRNVCPICALVLGDVCVMCLHMDPECCVDAGNGTFAFVCETCCNKYLSARYVRCLGYYINVGFIDDEQENG